ATRYAAADGRAHDAALTDMLLQSDSMAHEAGYDAYMTGVVLIKASLHTPTHPSTACFLTRRVASRRRWRSWATRPKTLL
ncbi:MAG: hypothetical protein ACK4YT_13740, partial [Sphingomonas sp.]